MTDHRDSTAVVIGAMLVAPLMGPIFGISFGLATGNNSLLARSAAAEAKGVFLAIGLAWLIGLITLRLRGVFFAIATLALAVVVQTLIVHWDFVGGSRGIYIIRPAQAPLGGGYIQYLYTFSFFGILIV